MSMRNFIIRRVILMIPLFIGISILSFVVISLSPIDIVDVQTTGNPNFTPDDKQKMKEELHFVTRPETRYSAANTEVTVEAGRSSVFPRLRTYGYQEAVALYRFDNSSEATPGDSSKVVGNTITHQAYFNDSVETEMKNSSSVQGTDSIVIGNTNGWGITNELTISFWLNSAQKRGY